MSPPAARSVVGRAGASWWIPELTAARRASTALGRVAPGGCPPGAPTDPDVRVSRIRLFEGWICYAGRSRLSAGFGNGKRRRIRYMPFQ